MESQERSRRKKKEGQGSAAPVTMRRRHESRLKQVPKELPRVAHVGIGTECDGETSNRLS